MVKYFSMPADFKNETIDGYDTLNQSYSQSEVLETYGNITSGNKVGSGRVVNQVPDADLWDLKDFVEYSKSKNIGFNYTLNATHLQNREFTPEGISDIKRFLKDLYEAGVRSLTVSLPSLIELIQSTGLDFEIKASVLCQVTNVNKAVAFKKRGVDRIVVDESINRDFRNLRRICEAFGDGVEIIINTLCLKDCIYRNFHYNQITQDSIGCSNRTSVNYYEHRCVLQRFGTLGNLLRMCFVRPEDLKYYTPTGICCFKMQGRQQVLKGDAVRAVKAYFDENYDGDLMDLIYMFYPMNSFIIPIDNKKLEGFIKPFVTRDRFCNRDCETCNYCENFARKIIENNKANEVFGLAEDFYSQFDEFNTMVAKVDASASEKQTDPREKQIDVEFDL